MGFIGIKKDRQISSSEILAINTNEVTAVKKRLTAEALYDILH